VVLVRSERGTKAATRWRDARGHKPCRAGGARVPLGAVAALLSRGRPGQEGDAREPVAPGRRAGRVDPRLAGRHALPRGRRGGQGRAVAAGGARGRGASDGAALGAGAAVGPFAVARARSVSGDDLSAAAQARVQAARDARVGAVDAGVRALGRGRRRRRALRGAGLARRAPGRDPGAPRAPASGRRRAGAL
jgi:hypothetical protein